MDRPQFELFKAQVAAATAGQILELEDFIEHISTNRFTEMALARRSKETLRRRTCPHCQGNNIVLYGKDQNGRQRFKCRGCRRSYNILTGTPMARARMPEKWLKYLGCMTEHMSVRKIVASGIGIHQVTAWRWRHRFLQAAANDNAAILSGVIEADKTIFPQSFKGSRGWKMGEPPANRAARQSGRGVAQLGLPHDQVLVLTALDNSGGVFQAILKSRTDIEVALEGRIAAGSVLCSDGSAAYVTVANNAESEHYRVFVPVSTLHAVNIKPVAMPEEKPRWLGLGRVNHLQLGLQYLINEQCRGVATKYLRTYLGWHRAMIRSGFEGKALLVRALA
jgi:transposase-like protein